MSRTAIIVSFDRLPCAGLSCYGNEWIDTPAFDGLAAEGFVFDRAVAEQVRGDAEGVTFGPRLDSAWIAALRQDGTTATLLHEPHSELVVSPQAFDSVKDCGGADGFDVAAADLPFARLVQRAIVLLPETTATDRLLWLSSTGLPDICRPPEAALDLYFEEFAQHAIDWDTLSPEDFGRHPAIRAAYLSILDHWLGQLREAIGKVNEPTLLIVVGCEGRVWQPVPRRASVPGGLESQAVDVPWLMTSNDGSILPGRSAALVQLSDLPPTVLEWLSTGDVEASAPFSLALSPETGSEGTGAERPTNALPDSQLSTHNPQHSLWSLIRGDASQSRGVAITRSVSGAIAVRTATESVVFASELGTDGRCFLHPEDVWDVHDVAAMRPDVVGRATEWLSSREKTGSTVADVGGLR